MRFETLDMRQNTFTIKQSLPKLFAFRFWLLAFSLLLLAFMGCKKTDNFYGKLQSLPQIDNTNKYAYRPAYIIGDTMVVTGKLYPKNNLQITIGGKAAVIVKMDSVIDNFSELLDQAYLLISDDMVGKAKEVKITSSGYSALGAAIDVYTPGGLGSFDQSLKAVVTKTFNGGAQHVFLHCQNGKGDVYYYSATNKDVRLIKKDGSETTLFSLSGTLGVIGVPITEFVTGGVDPQGQQLYFSARTSPSDYVFCKVELTTKQLTVLNRSQDISAPYEGAVGAVKMTISGIYPDSKGNVYLGIGFNEMQTLLPDAIARYNTTDGRVSYIYKKVVYQNTFPGMPGTAINLTSNTVIRLRFSPDENLLYIMEQSFRDRSAIIDVFDLDARTKLNSLSTSDPAGTASKYNLIAPFSSLQINMGTGATPDDTFGYLPMPGKRLQTLLFQNLGGTASQQFGLPKWVVFDFTEQRTYTYAPGRFDQNFGAYIFHETDELLNYDEDGNLYATSNGKSYLIKTQAQ